MVKEITTIGELLNLPDLEDETKQTINGAVRELVNRYVNYKPPEEIGPLNDLQAKTLLNEWMNGQQKDGDT